MCDIAINLNEPQIKLRFIWLGYSWKIVYVLKIKCDLMEMVQRKTHNYFFHNYNYSLFVSFETMKWTKMKKQKKIKLKPEKLLNRNSGCNKNKIRKVNHAILNVSVLFNLQIHFGTLRLLDFWEIIHSLLNVYGFI